MEKIDCDHLLKKIQELEFASVDLTLYLDNHPTCKQAISDYNTITEKLEKLKKVYEAEYGPLTHFGGSPSQYPWRWVSEPWPWETGI
ncbi:MAG: spore coat protein CotJB [Clostridiales bacterium]|nr:spore coat protein CotJB [Clostridiales bacterium]